ncbi:GAF and ANTAR domain-containing protein [Streptomyces sp. NBC_00467]|uniref:GAF and ANTAR domain-containing protein n=1 Tax=Streptomyces sp. NBC_00467 TaxID=2975752 RepID=UPI002E16E7E9
MNDQQYNAIPSVMGLLLETTTMDEFLQALADTGLQVSGAEGCGVTMLRQGRPMTVVSAGTSALRLDEKQYGQDDGPCLQALRTGEEVLVSDLRTEGRWGEYPAYAVELGSRSSLSLPIAAHSHTAGALNFYAPEPNAFDGFDRKVLRSLAAQATGGIALAQRLADVEEFAEDLQTALKSRAVIDQAIGVIMAQQRCGSEEAFAILRSASQHRNVKLRDLCAGLLTNLAGEPPTEPDLKPRP